MRDQLELSGLNRLESEIKKLGTISYGRVMTEWERLLHEDNTRSAMAGLQGKPISRMMEALAMPSVIAAT